MEKRERIQKVMAAAGYGSRRACEDMVRAGLVRVNGKVVSELPVLVDTGADDIRIEGRRLKRARLVYYLLHKPKGVLCTNSDPAGRVRAIDLLIGVRQRVYPVGRLDASSTGLLLMTNDGDLAERLTHPRYGVEKTYQATIAGRISGEAMEKMKKGVWLAEAKTQGAKVKALHRGHQESVLEIKLREGRNRHIRRVLARLGHKVLKLKRTRIGGLSIRGLGPGSFRPLTTKEIALLKKKGKGESEEKREATSEKRKTRIRKKGAAGSRRGV